MDDQLCCQSEMILRATQYDPLSPRSIYLQTTIGTPSTVLAIYGCRSSHSPKIFFPRIKGRMQFVRLPARYTPPVHICCTTKFPIVVEQILINRSNTLLLIGSGCQELQFAKICSDVWGSADWPRCFWRMNCLISGIAGPQKDRSKEIYLKSVLSLRQSTNSFISGSIIYVSICPPSDGSTYILWFVWNGAENRMELPRPVPGPITPLVLCSIRLTPFIDSN